MKEKKMHKEKEQNLFPYPHHLLVLLLVAAVLPPSQSLKKIEIQINRDFGQYFPFLYKDKKNYNLFI